MTYGSIHDFIVGKENEYEHPIAINGWEWSMKDHIKTSFYYKHGRLINGNDENTPVKNITRPLLNLQYRSEDIDVKDILLYVDDPQHYHLSFLVKKYHDDVFVVKNDLDTFIDDTNESKIDYGGALIKEMPGVRPEVVDMQSIAFCDQTDILKGPIGIKHYFNPAELKEMEAKGWGSPSNGANMSIDEIIALAEEKRDEGGDDNRENDTPGSYIEVYEVHGVLPQYFVDDSDSQEYTQQFHIAAFYTAKDGERRGVSLFRKKVAKSPFKFIARDKIFSRGLGFGGAEELFENQVWTNYDVIRMKELLDATSKVILKAVGTDFKSKYPNGLADVDNLQILEMNEGEDINQIDTTPRSMVLFEKSVAEWERHAQLMASASDPLLGEPAPSGTPFKAQALQVVEGKALHDYRRGKFAKFLEEVYRDWIIPYIVREITNGTKFLTELSTEELQFVVDKVVENEAFNMQKERVLRGETFTAQEVELFKNKVREDFLKDGNKKFLEILKGEFKGKTVRVKINVAGKQKDVSLMTDKLVNIFRQIIANPQGFMQVMQTPGMSRTFNDILEYSGLSPVYFSGLTAPNTPTPQPVQPEIQNLQEQNNNV